MQKRTGPEIDFVIPEAKTALEVKTKPHIIDYRKTIKYAELLNFKETYIISKEYSDEPWCIPFDML